MAREREGGRERGGKRNRKGRGGEGGRGGGQRLSGCERERERKGKRVQESARERKTWACLSSLSRASVHCQEYKQGSKQWQKHEANRVE